MKTRIRAIAFTLAALLSGSSATAFVLVTDEPNFIGFLAIAGSVTFDRSAAIGNSIGFLADNDSRAMISRSLISHSSISGIIAQGTSQVHVAGTTIPANALGLNAVSGGQILSRGDNRLAGNSTDGSFTGTFPPQ